MFGSSITFEGNLAAAPLVKRNQADSIYVDAVVLVNQGPDRTPTRWNVRISGHAAGNATNLTTGDRLLVVGSVVTDSWVDAKTGEVRHADKVLAEAVGMSLTFARVTGIERNPAKRDEHQDAEQ